MRHERNRPPLADVSALAPAERVARGLNDDRAPRRGGRLYGGVAFALNWKASLVAIAAGLLPLARPAFSRY